MPQFPADALLAWYDRHRRAMPWRAQPGQTPDPYHVWLSEIMLQQTNVATVTPYYTRFLARFPTVAALAAAPDDDVMAAWAGLGYYARARNMLRCARAVAAAGHFPASIAGLRALPGVGVYTADAVASIAYGIPVVPVDGNVERIAARVFAIAAPLPKARAPIALAARTLNAAPLARARPADFTQALFDLGATICTRNPACAICPVRPACAGHAAGIAAELPRRAVKTARPIRHGAHFHLTDAAGRLLLRRRPPTGLLGGMAELPGTDWRATPWAVQAALALAPGAADWRPAGTVRHIFTHFELRLDVYAATTATIDAPGFLVEPAQMAAQALPSLMRKCLALVTL